MVVSLRNVTTVNQSLLKTLSDKVKLSTCLIETINGNVILFEGKVNQVTSIVTDLEENVANTLIEFNAFTERIKDSESNILDRLDRLDSIESASNLSLFTFDFEGSNVGINNISPLEALDVTGFIRVSDGILNGGDYLVQSDERLKTDVSRIKNPFKLIDSINGYTFMLKKDEKDGISSKRRLGLLAQEVAIDLPEVVEEDSDGFLSVAYGNIVSVLIEAVKDLNSRVKELEKERKT